MVSAARSQFGFTLIEVMLALGILVFAMSTLIAAMFGAAGEHRGSDMRLRATHMVDTVIHDILEDHILQHADVTEPLPPLSGEDLEGYEGLVYAIVFLEDPKDLALVQARIRIAWKEQGSSVGVDFERILVRQIPFSRRVKAAREQRRLR